MSAADNNVKRTLVSRDGSGDDEVRYIALDDAQCSVANLHVNALFGLSDALLRSVVAMRFMHSDQYRELARHAIALANLLDECRLRTHAAPVTPQ